LARTRLRVPRSEEKALARVLSLSDAEVGAIHAALAESEPALSVRRLADRVAEKTGLASDLVYNVVRTLAVLYTARDRSSTSMDEFLADVERAAKEASSEDLKAPKIGWESARARIKRFLTIDRSLGITAKAYDLLNEYERVFCDARVVTDVRPIFTADVAQKPDAAILVHTLRIAYHEGGDLKAVYVSMDTSDVASLMKLLERATKKEAGLEPLAKGAGIPLLRATTHED
jgi:hypothetical protein